MLDRSGETTVPSWRRPFCCRIEDYAAIGDARTAALVSKEGSLDWLCWPRADSPALFSAILDRERGGTFRIRPTGLLGSSRRYLPDTNVLETRFSTASGDAVLTDLMPVATEEEKRELLLPEHELLRRITCTRGAVEVEILYAPRPGFGTCKARLKDLGKLGLRLTTGAAVFILRSEAPLTIVEGRDGQSATARIWLSAGESLRLSLVYASDGAAVLPALGEQADAAIRRTVSFWKRWAGRARYQGPLREQVVRSALTLKQLCFAPSGAIIAAPTTSLPERVGGDLNWDYRYCWLRDASLTARALFGLGYREEAESFVSWLLHATRLTSPELQVLYDVYGETGARERRISGLRGFRGSSPVRVGNAARSQLQLDGYGEVIDATAQLVELGGTIDRETQDLLRQLGLKVCQVAHLPDQGIWEPREPPRHHTHSKLLCWAALDRLVRLDEIGAVKGLPLKLFRTHRARLRGEIHELGFNARLQSYTQTYGGEEVDSSLLLLSWHGFEAPGSPRMLSTARLIDQRLGAGPGLLYRNQEGIAVGEGAFVICSFWRVEHLALGGGTLAEAERALEEVAAHANELGLFSEEIDPTDGSALGNFPQGFSHVGLVNAALSVEERRQREQGRRLQERVPSCPRITAQVGEGTR